MLPSAHMRLLHHILTIITSLGAIHIGLIALGYNVLTMPALMSLAEPIAYIIGLSGLLNLIIMFMHHSSCQCPR